MRPRALTRLLDGGASQRAGLVARKRGARLARVGRAREVADALGGYRGVHVLPPRTPAMVVELAVHHQVPPVVTPAVRMVRVAAASAAAADDGATVGAAGEAASTAVAAVTAVE